MYLWYFCVIKWDRNLCDFISTDAIIGSAYWSNVLTILKLVKLKESLEIREKWEDLIRELLKKTKTNDTNRLRDVASVLNRSWFSIAVLSKTLKSLHHVFWVYFALYFEPLREEFLTFLDAQLSLNFYLSAPQTPQDS